MFRKLTPEYGFDYKSLESRFSELAVALTDVEREFDREAQRKRLEDEGYGIEKLSPHVDSMEVSLLTTDASIAKKELRFHCLWALHAVALNAVFDCKQHHDVLVGQEKVPYRDLKYDSIIEVGEYKPYMDMDHRSDSLRVQHELGFLMESMKSLNKIDYLLVDGSLYTTGFNLKSRLNSGYPEHKKAVEAYKQLLESGKAVGLVEDSHSIDVSSKLGLNMTNLLFFDLVLDPLEYVVDSKSDGINACYVKLPSKQVPYLPSKSSTPFTVRWEFTQKNYVKYLEKLAGMWTLETDLVHSQLYPVRVADYLTRKIKVGGILDNLVKEHNLELKHREQREG